MALFSLINLREFNLRVFNLCLQRFCSLWSCCTWFNPDPFFVERVDLDLCTIRKLDLGLKADLSWFIFVPGRKSWSEAFDRIPFHKDHWPVSYQFVCYTRWDDRRYIETYLRFWGRDYWRVLHLRHMERVWFTWWVEWSIGGFGRSFPPAWGVCAFNFIFTFILILNLFIFLQLLYPS